MTVKGTTYVEDSKARLDIYLTESQIRLITNRPGSNARTRVDEHNLVRLDLLDDAGVNIDDINAYNKRLSDLLREVSLFDVIARKMLLECRLSPNEVICILDGVDIDRVMIGDANYSNTGLKISQMRGRYSPLLAKNSRTRILNGMKFDSKQEMQLAEYFMAEGLAFEKFKIEYAYEKDGVKRRSHTIPDYIFKTGVCVYLDGYSHDSNAQMDLDLRQNKGLADLGYVVIRVPMRILYERKTTAPFRSNWPLLKTMIENVIRANQDGSAYDFRKDLAKMRSSHTSFKAKQRYSLSYSEVNGELMPNNALECVFSLEVWNVNDRCWEPKSKSIIDSDVRAHDIAVRKWMLDEGIDDVERLKHCEKAVDEFCQIGQGRECMHYYRELVERGYRVVGVTKEPKRGWTLGHRNREGRDRNGMRVRF